MVAKANACREPWAVVVHLEDTATTRAAMVGAIGLSGMAFFAVSHLAVGLHCEVCCNGWSLCG